MTALAAASTFPKTNVEAVDGSTITLGAPRGDYDWQLVVVYRGLHCPICKTYLSKLQEVEAAFNEQGVDVVAVSGDPKEKAQKMADEKNLDITIGYGLTPAQMKTLGVYISDPRSPEETDRPFAEPAMFVVNGDGKIQIIDVSNAPFARPELDGVAGGIKFIRSNDYPIRGTHSS
ncbi:MAG: peroxiredoxin-like family protein [Sulfitobacter sp.]